MGDIGLARDMSVAGDILVSTEHNSLPRYHRVPKGQHTRLIDENRLKGFISDGQWAYDSFLVSGRSTHKFLAVTSICGRCFTAKHSAIRQM